MLEEEMGKIPYDNSEEKLDRVGFDSYLKNCPECGAQNRKFANVCFKCGKLFLMDTLDEDSSEIVDGAFGFLVCEKCYGFYELQEDELPEDFDYCQCGGNLVFVDNFDEVENLRDNCRVCGTENPLGSEFCYECGRPFEEVFCCSKSSSKDIEITANFIMIYKKKGFFKKIVSIDIFEREKIGNLELIESDGLHLRFNYENTPINIKITSKQAEDLENHLNIRRELFTCLTVNCDYSGLLKENDICPKCKQNAGKIDQGYYKIFRKQKKIKKM